MLLSEVREFLKTKVECPQWYIGKIDNSKEQCIGIYGVVGPTPRIAIGGLENTSYNTKAVSILIHWTKNCNTAELKAQEIYDSLFGQEGTIEGKRIIKFDMRTPEPVGIGTDSNGVFEFVIETVIYYER